MNKLDEMWVSLEAYLPQAQAAGYGESWARMCKEKTRTAANAAAYSAYSAAAALGVARAYATATAEAASDAAYAVVDPAGTDFLAQKAINKINSVITKVITKE